MAFGIEVVEIALRDKLGVSVDIDEINNRLEEIVMKLLSDKTKFSEQIKRAKEQYLFYPGRNGEAGGKYIIGQLDVKQKNERGLF